MNRKILAVDLDDTLFDDKKGICKENMDALRDLLDAGHILAVDTGRPTHVMKKLLSPFGIFDRENVYFLGFQGTVAARAIDNKLLFGHFLDNAAALKLLRYAVNAGLSCIAFEFGNIYSFRQDSNVDGYADVSKEHIDIISSPDELAGHDLTKIMVIDFDNHRRLEDFRALHEDELSASFVSMFSNIAFLEYVGKGLGKGTGLKELADLLSIDMKNTVACGDHQNDISMVEAARVGVAVKNGQAELKAVADYVTTVDNNNGAVAEAIRRFVLKD